MPKTVVIIGASFAGVAAAKYVASGSDVSVIIINPDKKLYFNVAAPRLLVQPELLDKATLDLEVPLKDVKHKFIVGTATSVLPDTNLVVVATKNGDETVTYDYLVVATGLSSSAKWIRSDGLVEESRLSLTRSAEKLKTAKTIAIVGAGPTGVEIAGELAYTHGNAKIDLYSGGANVLSTVNPKRQKDAAQKLKKLNVNIHTSTMVYDITEKSVRVNDKVKTYDFVVNTVVSKPNTSFLPSELLDKNGFLDTDQYLVSKTKKNILGLGDVCSITDNTSIDMNYNQIKVFKATVNNYIFGKNTALKAYSKPGSTTILIPIGPNDGVGELFGWGAPGFLVRKKAKDFFLAKAMSLV